MKEPTAQTAKRRRWISIGETVGILALIVSAVSLWDSHQDRVETRAAAAQQKSVKVAPLVLTATADAEGETLRLASTNSDRVIQTQTIVFPKALGIDSVDTVGNPRIEVGWFASGLHEAADETRGKGRLPVGIITRYTDTTIEGTTDREDVAIYDIGHGWRSRLLQSDVPVLEGVTLVARAPRDLQARLDARWTKAHPPKP